VRKIIVYRTHQPPNKSPTTDHWLLITGCIFLRAHLHPDDIEPAVHV